MKKMIIIILFVAELSSWATREYMVQTARPNKPCTILDIYFNDLGCFYTGNIYIFGEIVGDYYADSIQEITEAFPHLAEAINNALN